MQSITKARNWSNRIKQASHTTNSKVPKLFRPPFGGAQYFGQAYRWEQVLHYKFWVFVAIKAWIREIAGGESPNIGKLVTKENQQGKAIKKRWGIHKALGGPKEHQEFEPYSDNHPLIRLFANPNGPDVAYDLWAYTVLFKLLTGSAHWYVIKNRLNTPVELWVIPTHWMRLETDKEGLPDCYTVQNPWGRADKIPFDDVISFYDHSPLNRYEGSAVSQAINEWLDAYESSVRARLAQYKNGAIPSYHVSLGESYDPDEAFLERYYAKWLSRFQGENNTGRPVITGGDIEIKPLGISPIDMGYTDAENSARDNTLCAFGVPKAVVGLTENMTYGSVKAERAAFREYAINPDLLYISQVVTEKLIKPIDPEGSFWWDKRTDDPDQMLKEIESRRAGGTITPNEERSLLGAEAYPHGGDDPLVNGVEMPWVTGKPKDNLEDENIDLAFKRALNVDNGSAGGYLVGEEVKEGREEQEGRGEQEGKEYRWDRCGQGVAGEPNT